MREQLRAASKRPAGASPQVAAASNGQAGDVEKFIQKVQALMWERVGVVREGKALQQVVPELRALQEQAPSLGDRRSHEAANILQAGLLIARSALAREESRGAHYRLDHPLKNDAKYRKHSVVTGDQIRFE
jgi:L-aspartate oxidase